MIFAISAAPAAIPVNPKIAAITAMIRNVKVQRNITFSFSFDSITNHMPPRRAADPCAAQMIPNSARSYGVVWKKFRTGCKKSLKKQGTSFSLWVLTERI